MAADDRRMRNHTRRPRAEYEALLVRKQNEQLTYRELSSESGVPTCTLQYWARKFREAVASDVGEQQPSAFSRIDLEPNPPSAIEVVLAGNVRVAVRPGFDEATLRAVIEALAC